jgi:signal transduction histidine kinase/predicted transcriptional regulator
MRLAPATLRSGRTWWWSFGLLIAVPALVLALLGLRAARVEHIERQQQLRVQQGQIGRLADAAISNVLARLEGEVARAETSEGVLREYFLFSLDRQGLLVFPRERVYFGEFGKRPAAARGDRRGAVQTLIEQAQAAEAQRRPGDALAAYRSVIGADPKLREWAELSVARIRYVSGEADALPLLAKPEWSRSEGLTPTGLPTALLACAHIEQVAPEQRSQFIPLLRATMESLRGGRWWLSYEERQFHDEELRRWLADADPGRAVATDERLEQLVAIERAVHRSLPYLRQGVPRSFEADQQAAFLILWAPSERTDGSWFGVAVPRRPLSGLLDAALAPLFSAQPGGAAVRDAAGYAVWNRLASGASVVETVRMRSVPGWELAFAGPAEEGPLDQRRVLWYGFIVLLVMMLMVGLAMTIRVVQREVELGRLQTDFLAAVTHEFKSPITSIRLLAERIGGGRLRTPEATAEYGAAIEREAGRLERLVNRLLETQKIQAGQKRYTFQPASLVESVEAAIAQLRPQAEAKGVSIELDSAGEIAKIEIDKAAIADALENLLDNAIKYSSAGTHVRVGVRVVEGQACVEVCDQGIGIDPADLPRVFEKFFRGRRGDQHNVHGTGLGLALVKAAAEGHGGTVEATSTPGRGSTFRLRLPLQHGDRNHGANPDRG